MSDKAWDSQSKLSPTPKYLVDDKARDSQPKFSATPKFPVADKACDFQPKLSPTTKFALADEVFVNQFRTKYGILNQTCKPTTITKHLCLLGIICSKYIAFYAILVH